MNGTEVEVPVNRPSTLKSPILVSGRVVPAVDASAALEAVGVEDPNGPAAAGEFAGVSDAVAGYNPVWGFVGGTWFAVGYTY